MPHSFLLLFVVSVACSALLTRTVRDLALSREWVDAPDSIRHLHRTPVPRLGGVALFLTLLGLAGGGALARGWVGPATAFSISTTFGILGPATLIFLVGLYDDFRRLGPATKFGAQVVAACLLYFGHIRIHQFTFLFGGDKLSWIFGLPLTIGWVLLITNAFNLIDGLDGLAAGAALFSTLVLLVAALLGGNHFVALLAVVLAGAIAGFLRFNFSPATIFLGDCGSLFIGFLLSALALAGSQKASTMVAVAIPVVCFGLPILDVAIAVARRFLNGRPLFRPDNEHIHHRLLKRGFSHRDAVLILYGVSALFGLLSLGLLHGGGATALVLVILGIGVCVGVPQLRYQEFAEMRRVLERTASQKQIFVNNLHVRRAVESLRACDDASDLFDIVASALRPSDFDGFRLKVRASRDMHRPLPALMRAARHGGWQCSWRTPGCSNADWELRLELLDEDGQHCGTLSVFKRLTGKPLMMDINLLAGCFQTALAGAVRRAIIDSRPRGEASDQKLKARAASAPSA